MSKKKFSRYKQITDVQRNALHDERPIVVLEEQINSFIGPRDNLPFFRKEIAKFRKTVEGWCSAPEFIYAFMKHCNEPKKRIAKRAYEASHSQFKNGFAKFLNQEKFTAFSISDFDAAFIKKYIFWLKTYNVSERVGVLSPNTQRKYYGILVNLLNIMRESKSAAHFFSDSLSFPDNPFVRAHAATKQTETVDDFIWKRIILACRQDVREIYDSVLSGWELLDGEEILPDDTARGRGRYAYRGAALWRIKHLFPTLIPKPSDMKIIDRDLKDSILYIHKQDSITRPFYPLVKDIVPFILLQAIYSLANTGGLRSMKWEQISEIDVLGVRRVLYSIEKERGTSYGRSFVVQSDDIFSPFRLHEFIKRWTSKIRLLAKNFEDNVYIFVAQSRRIRAFHSSADTGVDSDSSWNSAMKQFMKRHSLPHFTLKVIRNTGLDVIRELTNDDMRAVQGAGGQTSIGVLELHYDGSAAKRRRQEDLVGVMTLQERRIRSGGRIDPRFSPKSEDIFAATPGWGCNDIYNSPIPGQTEGTPCAAFGRCPACPLTYLNNSSSYSLARVLQLAEEIRKAQTYLDARRWSEAYEPVLKALVDRWIPSFDNKEVRDGAAKIVLNSIGRLD